METPSEGFFGKRPQSPMNAFIAYVQASLEELRHVRWPTRQQAIRLSGTVLGFTAVTAVIFGFVDFTLAELVRLALL